MRASEALQEEKKQKRERQQIRTLVADDMAAAAREAWERNDNDASIAASLMAINANLERLMMELSEALFFIGDRP